MRITYLILLGGIFLPAVLEAQPGQPAVSIEPTASQTVLVVLTTRGVSLSHRQVKAGRIRFVLDNRTPLHSPELQISLIPQAGGAGKSAVVDKPANATKNNRSSSDTTLDPGNYALSIRGVTGALGQITVHP